MPFIKKIELDKGVIGLWEINETLEDFENLIPELSGDEKYHRITNNKRKLELLSVRALLSELTGKFTLIKYKKNGCPFLPDSDWHISISHSTNLAAIILHKNKAGIDVETEGRQINKIATKFISEKELSVINQSELKNKIILLQWCAKEAVYKLTGHPGTNFKTQILLNEFNPSEKGFLNAQFISPENSSYIQLNYQFLKNNAVVWCVE
jgi:phosphopantetheinyl transferase